MPYILQGTIDLLNYRHTLGRPCSIEQMSQATRILAIHFRNNGKTRVAFSAQYGEREAQALAALLGVAVSDVSENGGQVLI